MSHSVCYVLDVSGSDFATTCVSSRRASPADIAQLIETGALWDCEGAVSGIGCSVELTGVVTLIWLTAKYSQFVGNEDIRASVLSWERVALAPFDQRTVIRLDELVLEDWQRLVGALWFRDSLAAGQFWAWIRGQSPESWSPLTESSDMPRPK